MTVDEIKAQHARDKVRCQEVLDRISMFNPHSLILAAMDSNGKIVIARIQSDPGIECLLSKAIEIGTLENISNYIRIDPKGSAPNATAAESGSTN